MKDPGRAKRTASPDLKPADKAALVAILLSSAASVVGTFLCPEETASRLLRLELLRIKPGRDPGRGTFGRWKHAELTQAGKDAAEKIVADCTPDAK